MSRSEASMRCSAARARSIARSLRSRALRLRPAIFLRMCSLQRRDDVKEVVSLLLVHFDLPHPSVRVCLGDHALCLSKFRFVDFQEADIRAKVSAVQASVRMRTRTGDNRYGAVTICERLSENVAGEPLEVASVERSIFRYRFPGHIDQGSLQVLRQFFFHGGVMDVRIAACHLRSEMTEIALDDVVGHAQIDHARSDRVAELMGLKAKELAIRISDFMVVS